MARVTVVVDADACVPEGLRSDLGILTAPLDAPSLTGAETVVALTRDPAAPPADAAPEACRRAAEHSEAVLYISAENGGADDGGADAAATRAAESVGGGVTVLHHPSGSALMGCGWQAIAAAVAAGDGADLRQAAAAAAAVREHAKVLTMLEHPQLLNVAGPFAALRRRRTIVRVAGEAVEVVERLGRRDEALVALRDRFGAEAGDGPGLRVAVLHAAAEAAAEAMARWLERTLRPAEVLTAPLTRHAAARFGPGMVGFAWYREPPA